jgi:hypothetical protein
MALNTSEVRLGLDQHRLRRWMPYILGHESAVAWASGEDAVDLYWFNDGGGELTGEYEYPMVVA